MNNKYFHGSSTRFSASGHKTLKVLLVILFVGCVFLSAAPADPSATMSSQDIDRLGSDALFLGRNRFNPRSSEKLDIVCHVHTPSRVRIDIYTLSGREHVVNIVDKIVDQAGSIQTFWGGKNAGGEIVASGVYIIQMRTSKSTIYRMIAVVKR